MGRLSVWPTLLSIGYITMNNDIFGGHILEMYLG